MLALIVVASCLWTAVGVLGQGPGAGASVERVHASVIFSLYGERTPFLSEDPVELSTLGARQMFSAGSFFRSRYITSRRALDNATAGSPIEEIRTQRITSEQVYVEATSRDWVTSSALAFMQGLYPPLNATTQGPSITADSLLANGSTIQGPLGGYQYPSLNVPSISDPNAIWLAGDVGCTQYIRSASQYFDSPDFTRVEASSRDLYGNVANQWLRGSLPDAPIDYRNAHPIFEAVRYADTHNRSVHAQVPAADLARLRMLASEHEFALNGDLSASGLVAGDNIRSVAGKMLATRIIGLLMDNIESRGSIHKISLMFGNYKPFLAFFALARLPDVSSNFRGLPHLGSSMVFELFSVRNDTNGIQYPDEQDLKVRFLFRNGTSDSDELTAYPLFNRGRSMTTIPWTEFRSEMSQVMVPTVGDWCELCDSRQPFCALYSDRGFWGSLANSERRDNSKRLSPVVAGVVGAIVTLAVIAIATAAIMLLGGFRFHRTPSKRRSELGGFKGAEKLASDPDLTSGKVQDAEDSRGQERIGSWELTSGASAGGKASGSSKPRAAEEPRPNEVEDLTVSPFADPVRVEDRV